MRRMNADLSGNVLLRPSRTDYGELEWRDTTHCDIEYVAPLGGLSRHCAIGCIAGVPRLIHEALPLLREQRKLSRSRLSRMTVQPGNAGIGEKTIQALEDNPGRVPEARIIEAIANALGVPPEHFYEWPIAVARREAKERAAAAALRGHEERGRRRDGVRDATRPETTQGPGERGNTGSD